MIIDRYDPVRLFDLVPQLQLELEPELAGLDRLLDDDVLFQRVKADLARRAPLSLVHGRHATPVEVILRMLVVRRLYHGATPRPNSSCRIASCCASSVGW